MIVPELIETMPQQPPDLELELLSLRDDYGLLRVSAAGEYRFLTFGDSSEQSCCYLPEPHWLEYDYTRAMLLGCHWAPVQPRVALLGLGAGSLANALLAHFAPQQLDAVELRPQVLELARAHFALADDPRLRVHVGCAEQWLLRSTQMFDLLMVDLYMEGGISRLQLQAEFFRLCRQRLTPQGVLVINQWQMGSSGRPYAERQLRAVLGDYLQVQVEEGNMLLFAAPEGCRLPLQRSALRDWAACLQAQLGYSLQPFVNDLQAG